MKQCSLCGQSLPLSDFYKHPTASGGVGSKCKTCSRAYGRNRYHTHRKLVASYMASERGKAKKRARMKKKRDQGDPVLRAHEIAAYARKKGLLVPTPCVHCGATKNIHGHHRDYSKPLDVIWCCHRCHRTIEHGHQWHETAGGVT